MKSHSRFITIVVFVLVVVLAFGNTTIFAAENDTVSPVQYGNQASTDPVTAGGEANAAAPYGSAEANAYGSMDAESGAYGSVGGEADACGSVNAEVNADGSMTADGQMILSTASEDGSVQIEEGSETSDDPSDKAGEKPEQSKDSDDPAEENDDPAEDMNADAESEDVAEGDQGALEEEETDDQSLVLAVEETVEEEGAVDDQMDDQAGNDDSDNAQTIIEAEKYSIIFNANGADGEVPESIELLAAVAEGTAGTSAEETAEGTDDNTTDQNGGTPDGEGTGASGENETEISVLSDEDNVSIPGAGKLTMSNRNFRGWNTKADGSGEFIFADSELTVAKIKELAAAQNPEGKAQDQDGSDSASADPEGEGTDDADTADDDAIPLELYAIFKDKSSISGTVDKVSTSFGKCYTFNKIKLTPVREKRDVKLQKYNEARKTWMTVSTVTVPAAANSQENYAGSGELPAVSVKSSSGGYLKLPYDASSGKYRFYVSENDSSMGTSKSFKVDVSYQREGMYISSRPKSMDLNGTFTNPAGNQSKKFIKNYSKKGFTLKIRLTHGYKQTLTLTMDGKTIGTKKITKQKKGTEVSFKIPSSWGKNRNRYFVATSVVKTDDKTKISHMYFKIHTSDPRERMLKWIKKQEGVKKYSSGHAKIVKSFNKLKITMSYKYKHKKKWKTRSIREVLRSSDHWCAAFVSVAAAKGKVSSSLFPYNYNCAQMMTYAQSKGIWKKYNCSMDKLEPGDLVLYDWSRNHGYPDHVGMIIKVNAKKKKLTVIEGNTSGHGSNSAVVVKTINMKKKGSGSSMKRTSSQVTGFITPKYPKIKK